jgi:hypothetical protein
MAKQIREILKIEDDFPPPAQAPDFLLELPHPATRISKSGMFLRCGEMYFSSVVKS